MPRHSVARCAAKLHEPSARRFGFCPSGPLTDWPASPASAKRGCSFFWHCHHLGGYFSLSKQRKVTRPPAGGRKPAVPQGLPSGRNEPGRRIAQSKQKPKSLDPCLRRGDGVHGTLRRGIHPRLAGQAKTNGPIQHLNASNSPPPAPHAHAAATGCNPPHPASTPHRDGSCRSHRNERG